MAESIFIRLLHKGLADTQGTVLSRPFTPDELQKSALHADVPNVWEAKNFSSVEWLEHGTGNADPVYLAGDSTSALDIANALTQKGLFPEWASVLCLSQSSGRGQMRRHWFSPAGNLYAAIRLPLMGVFAASAAPTAIGALLANALSSLGLRVLLKWPNDILQSPKGIAYKAMPYKNECHKAGGILLEERNGVLIAGIGLNIVGYPLAETLRENHAFSADILRFADGTAFAESKSYSGILPFWSGIAESIKSCHENKSSSDSWWLDPAKKYLAFKGCAVQLADAVLENGEPSENTVSGILEDILPNGALKLSTCDGDMAFLGGSLLPRIL